jgi:DNA-binding NtrC family response regulator
MHTERKHAVIVVVDDEPGIRSLFEMILSRRGHTISSASSICEGLAACSASPCPSTSSSMSSRGSYTRAPAAGV